MNRSTKKIDLEKIEQIERGKRIKNIRENELHMNKTQLAKEIGVSGQFLGLVEDGKGNLVYKSIKKLRTLSGHSADYILYGLDDNIINETKECLEKYSETQIVNALEILKDISIFIKNT
jgi:DNA-binding XRE family transcriptional regulator